ncbi:hypothetical protein KC19_3G120000 [Ceratodon purpureus]|uniref:Expansin n=1 Tax=Ceratodon purpureus TaxID=3225 RepID=A0A8T0IK41_CERPU|nr:hypothetical protein KC19_3G120000 [Ceratodon purpureus]KAG0583235.1 hypothetical protein KC19_3G120000 [Ceratodon purpureus]KAG0583236.1 hypothetical protein KC19_3G120000 [Ceratodon purpureus]
MAVTSSMKVGALMVVVLMVIGLPSGTNAQRWKGGAHITFYGSPNGGGTQAGACGYQNTYKLGYGSMTAALSSPLFRGGSACGACYQIRCAPVRRTRTARNWCYSYARTITITATNLCPPGSTGGWCNPPRAHFDLPMPAFLTLARREGGVAPVYYRKVRCAKRGGIRFTIGGNPWFLMVLIHNVGGAGDMRSVRVKGQYTNWYPMYRNWGALWTVRTKLSGALSFAVTTSNGRTVVARNVVGKWWKFGQTWEARTNFRY